MFSKFYRSYKHIDDVYNKVAAIPKVMKLPGDK